MWKSIDSIEEKTGPWLFGKTVAQVMSRMKFFFKLQDLERKVLFQERRSPPCRPLASQTEPLEVVRERPEPLTQRRRHRISSIDSEAKPLILLRQNRHQKANDAFIWWDPLDIAQIWWAHFYSMRLKY